MAVYPPVTDLELFLITVEDDTEDAPWMVMSGLQSREVDVLIDILRLHVRRNRLPWYLETYLKVTMPRPRVSRKLDVAPDLLMAEADDRPRTSWVLRDEGKPPQFILEVSSTSSWERDTEDKPVIYEQMGVAEFAIFAPERRDGPALFGHRRDERGRWVPWHPDERGVLWSRELGGLGLYVEDRLWLRAVTPGGERLPTPGELAEAEASRREAAEARAAAAAERGAAAEAEAARLREELRRLREERS